MTNACLIVSRVSYRYITSVVDYISGVFRKAFGEKFRFVVADEVDEVDVLSPSILFVIGEPFRPFRRRAGCYHVYLNFSVLCNLGQSKDISSGALRMQARKRLHLRRKLGSVDHLLDYYPEQVPLIGARLPCPVQNFPVGVLLQEKASLPIEERPFHVGFVGGVSPRRQAVLEDLKRHGLRLSPQTGVVLEDALRQSRLCLNIHIQQALHVEYPRVLGAFSSGAALITEESHGMDQAIPGDAYIATGYDRIGEEVRALLKDPEKIRRVAGRAREWLVGEHLPRCDREWSRIVDDIVGRSELG